MEEEKVILIPYIVHEGAQVRHERVVKRLICALILTILLMFATNAIWLWSWIQYDYVSEDSTINTNTVDIDGENGVATYVGDILNGADSGDIDNNTKKTQAENEKEWAKQRNP